MMVAIPHITLHPLEQYLTQMKGRPVRVLSMHPIGETASQDPLKTYGYGKPVLLEYCVEDGPVERAVFHTCAPSPFGHEHMSDRAQSLLWSHEAFNHLPRHVRSLDVGAFREDGSLVSLGDAREFCLLTEYVEGQGYDRDLSRLRDTTHLLPLDLARCDALCDYLAEIHRQPGPDPQLYTRRIRELMGAGECIMGLIDSYPAHPAIPARLLEQLELQCVQWRWRLKARAHRLRQVHGDFHPWNILFEPGQASFHLLDRSRGEWGDPADDVASLTANYLFFSLQRYGRLSGVLETLFYRFWDRYLAHTGDQEMLDVIAPFYVFRALVMASPVWYPNLPDSVRQSLFHFMLAVLGEGSFQPANVNRYCNA